MLLKLIVHLILLLLLIFAFLFEFNEGFKTSHLFLLEQQLSLTRGPPFIIFFFSICLVSVKAVFYAKRLLVDIHNKISGRNKNFAGKFRDNYFILFYFILSFQNISVSHCFSSKNSVLNIFVHF